MMYFCRFFGVLLLAFQPLLSAESDGELEMPSLQEVYADFVESNGGHTNIQSIKSIIATGRIQNAEGEETEFKLYRKRPDLMRLHVELEDYSIDTLFDGDSAYRRMAGELGRSEYQALGESETQRIKQDSAIEGPFYSLAKARGSLELVGIETVRGVECFRFDVSEEHLSPIRSIWISIDDLYEVKLLRGTRHADGELKEQSVYLSDFHKVEGLSVAKAVEHWEDGKKMQTVYIDEIRANAGVFDSFFAVE